MSLYPQSQGYAQVGYAHAGPAYPPVQPPPPPAYFAATQAMFYADPTHFRRDYTARLGQLTFNSRPHIQSLSMIAQDYTRYADIVVQCVEQHIRRVSRPSVPFALIFPVFTVASSPPSVMWLRDVYGGTMVARLLFLVVPACM